MGNNGPHVLRVGKILHNFYSPQYGFLIFLTLLGEGLLTIIAIIRNMMPVYAAYAKYLNDGKKVNIMRNGIR